MRTGKWRMPNERQPVNTALVHHFVFSIFQFSFLIAASLSENVAIAADTPPKLVGSASCATAACHGGLAGHKFVGSEFPIWSARDPHSRAYSVLRNDLSRQMAEQLKLPKPGHESAVCLNCHSPATSTDSKWSSISDRAPLAGVDCEQCHGPAERWLIPHVREQWKTRSVEDKRGFGYQDLSDVLTRANLCADCHVGSPGRDVNHDLIAAGHPRLFFELSTFHANLPKHWPSEIDAARHPVLPFGSTKSGQSGSLLEAKLWAVGQVVAAQRSLELLSHRAALAKDAPTKWPELAEWNCFACHHDLQSAGWWQGRDPSNRPRGKFAWNSWPYAMLEPLARQTRGPDVSSADSAMARLRSHFSKPLLPAEAISRDAAAAAKSLRVWAERLNQTDPMPAPLNDLSGQRGLGQTESKEYLLSPEMLDKLTRALVADEGQRLISRDWDSATQLFLSLGALQQATIATRVESTPRETERDRLIQSVLDSMNETLNFQSGLRSPRAFAAQPIDRLQSDLQRLQKLLSVPQP